MQVEMSRGAFFRAAIAAAAALVAGCATTNANHYRSASTKQASCCNSLSDQAARNACLSEIPRVDTAAAETSAVNAETFGCVERFFKCNAATGRATQESAQQQLDCINDLESTKQMPRS